MLSKGRLLLANFGLTETWRRETNQLDQRKEQFACARNKKEQIKNVCKKFAQYECNFMFSKLNNIFVNLKIRMQPSHIANTYSVRKLTRSAKGVSPSKLKENTHACTSIIIRAEEAKGAFNLVSSVISYKLKREEQFSLSTLLINLKNISYPSEMLIPSNNSQRNGREEDGKLGSQQNLLKID